MPNFESQINEMVEKKEKESGIKILLIEDQYYPQLALLDSIKKHLGEKIKDFSSKGDVRIVDNFTDAKKIAEAGDLKRTLVFLDNRMPFEPVDREGMKPFGQKKIEEKFGADSFSLYMEDDDFGDNPLGDGYELMEAFKKAGATVIGTSSLSNNEIDIKNLSSPDIIVVKNDADNSLEKEKERILSELEK